MTESRKRYKGPGCPLCVLAGGYAPEYEDEYSCGAWMGPPQGAQGRRDVCNRCVDKIERKKWHDYVFERGLRKFKEKFGDQK